MGKFRNIKSIGQVFDEGSGLFMHGPFSYRGIFRLVLLFFKGKYELVLVENWTMNVLLPYVNI